jgi:hypothetical protein
MSEGTLDYAKTLTRELNLLAQVRAKFEAME